MNKINIAVLVSGGGTNLQALIDAQAAGTLQSGTTELVISNNADAYALQRVEKRGLELDGEAREALRRALELRRGSGGFWGFHSVDVLIDDMLFAALRGKYAL